MGHRRFKLSRALKDAGGMLVFGIVLAILSIIADKLKLLAPWS